MSTLIVQYHPVIESFNTAVFESVQTGLASAGIEPSIVRVHEAAGDALVADDLAGIDHLIFVYPTWWGALPARLLEVMNSLIGDIVDRRSGAPSPFATVRRLSVVTTHGSARSVNRLQGEPGLALWKRVVRPLCSRGCSFDWVALYDIDRIDDTDRHAFLAQVTDTFGGVSANA